MRKSTNVPLIVGILLVLGSEGFWVDAKNDCQKYQVLDNDEMSCDVKREIVKAHNNYRQQVAKGLVKGQPRASNIREMYWDDELASGAQEWANRCTFAHNSNKEREVERFAVGQNLGITKSTGKVPNAESIDFPKHIKSWFDEHKLYKFAPIRNIKDVGHYTQLVWADTYLVGCGYIRYKVSKDTTNKLYTCNYGPAGNVIGKKPYEVGNLNCSNGLVQSVKYPGLCSMKNQPVDQCNEEDVSSEEDNNNPDEVMPSARGFSPSIEKIDMNESCSGENCNTNPMLSKIKKMKVNKTTIDPGLKKIYNLITINIFH